MNGPKRRLQRALSVAAAIGMIAVWPACSSGTAPQVSDTVPHQVAGSQPTFVMIEGAGFARGAAASIVTHAGTRQLDNVTWVNARVLTAQVPAGLPPGTYDVGVTNPGGGQATRPQAVTVEGAASPTQGSGGTGATATQVPARPPASTQAATAPPTRETGTTPAQSVTSTRTASPAQSQAPAVTRTATQPPTATKASTQPTTRPQSTPNLGGTWSILDTVTYGPGAGGQYPFSVVLQQSGNQLSGGGGGLAFTGTVSGANVHLDYVQDNGSTGSFDWALTSDSNALAGTFTNSTGNGGDSTARRVISGALPLLQSGPSGQSPSGDKVKKKGH